MSRHSLLPLAASLCLAVAGCGDNDLTDDGVANDVGDETAGTADTGETGDSGDTGEPEEMAAPGLGIHMTAVEANQGTAIFVGGNGQWVGGADRLGPLVHDRDTLLRIHYTVDDNWVPREIEARLRLVFGDGSEKVLSQVRMVDGPSAPNSLNEIFYFGLAASDGMVVPDMAYQVEFYEVDGGALADASGLSPGTWQTPPEPGLLGVQAELVELKVVFVPYHHKYQNIDRVADTSDANMKLITDYLFEQAAIHTLKWELHEPELWENPMVGLGGVLGPLAALRDNEMAFPNVYYHALFPIPQGGVAGVAGVALVPGDGKGEGDARVSVTALGNSVSSAAGVVVHEVGHTQGMNHVKCPFADAASPDPAYPYENGYTGQWGFGIISHQLYSPSNHFDYMSYCNPAWMSTWSWNKTFTRAVKLTSWDYLDEETQDPWGADKPLLHYSLTNTGDEFWWVGHGTLPETADPYGSEYPHHIELHGQGQLLAALPTVVRYSNDYSTAWVVAELPMEYERLEGVDQIIRVDDDNRAWAVPAHRVQLSERSSMAWK